MNSKYTPGVIEIINSEIADIDFTFKLFDQAIEYQKKNGYDLWPKFERELIEREIAEKRHWTVIHDDIIVGVFSIMYNDPIIWKEKDIDPSVYLHRIAVNPSFKGKRMMNVIRDWAKQHAKENNKKFVRMDTWGNNTTIRKYYISCGFNYIGQQNLNQHTDEQPHYGGSILSLFQIEV